MDHSSAAASLDALLSKSSSGLQRNAERPASCCCGKSQCAYLEHNNAALEGLESQLENAARIGQVGALSFLIILFDPSNETTNKQSTILPRSIPLGPSEHLVIRHSVI